MKAFIGLGVTREELEEVPDVYVGSGPALMWSVEAFAAFQEAINRICALAIRRPGILDGTNHADQPHWTVEELNGIETTLSQISSPTGKSYVHP